jgi:hypothetical protein
VSDWVYPNRHGRRPAETPGSPGSGPPFLAVVRPREGAAGEAGGAGDLINSSVENFDPPLAAAAVSDYVDRFSPKPRRSNAMTAVRTLTQRELEDLRDSVPFWFHSIDLGQGVVTPGAMKSAALLSEENKHLHLPNFRGKSVLDIGAWDGYYSFLAERGGASRVVALDH